MATIKEFQSAAMRIRAQFTELEAHEKRRTWSRGDIVSGLVADVGALVKLTMAADGLRVIADHPKKLGHELADCLWSLLVIAEEYQVDLEREFSTLCGELSCTLESKMTSKKSSK